MNLVKVILVASLFGGGVSATANENEFSSSEVAVIETGKPVYEDKIDISYLAKMVIHPEDDWIGKKVFKYDGVCVEVFKELKIKKIKKPFENLYRSANLPDVVEIGEMDVKTEVVECSLYESKITILK